ncbi:MAG: hypothetical protein KDB22_09550 [Planctomycetales bacterium]|nr:hypothetical protein [Planctomycetales bacterium]
MKVLDGGLQALEAQVTPCTYNDQPAPTKLAAGMRCETVFLDYGDQRLKIAADRIGDDGESMTADEARKVEMSLSRFVSENAHLAQLAISDHADWLLRYDDDQSKQLFVVPATGFPVREQGAELPPLFGPAPTGDAFDSWLSESLTRIARAQTLLRVSAQGMEDSGILDIQIVRYRNEEDAQPVEFGRGDVKLYDKDRIAIQVENTSHEPLDVTILMIDSGYGIYPLFPTRGRVNRLFPGNKVPSLTGKINAKTIGKEYLVVLALKGNPIEQPVSFAFLTQPTLERTRSGLGRGKNPLGELLSDAMFGGAVEMTRGSPPKAAEDYHIYTRSWTTMPTTRSE